MINITVGGPQASVELQARKTLEGNLLIMDHDLIDIVLQPESLKIVTFPKSQSADDVYGAQSRFFDFLSDKGIVDRQTVQGGNIFSSIEGVIPPSQEVNPLQAAVYVISQFLDDEADALKSAEQYEKEIEKLQLKLKDNEGWYTLHSQELAAENFAQQEINKWL